MPLQPTGTMHSSYHSNGTALESLKAPPPTHPLPLLSRPPWNHEVLADTFPPPTHKP